MKVKICGITNIDDAALCESLGADALGFIHFPGRRRNLPLEEISEICGSLGPFTPKVLVCQPESASEALELLDKSNVDILQVYALSPDELSKFRETGAKIIRAVKPDRSEAELYADYADAILFEGGKPGTGTSYDYSKIPIDCCDRSIIAGGLTPDNLDSAKAINPYALDVSSGVEREFGTKDPELVSEFIQRCRR